MLLILIKHYILSFTINIQFNFFFLSKSVCRLQWISFSSTQSNQWISHVIFSFFSYTKLQCYIHSRGELLPCKHNCQFNLNFISFHIIMYYVHWSITKFWMIKIKPRNRKPHCNRKPNFTLQNSLLKWNSTMENLIF